MLTAHSFNIGQPDNMGGCVRVWASHIDLNIFIVFVDEFLSVLRHQLDR